MIVLLFIWMNASPFETFELLMYSTVQQSVENPSFEIALIDVPIVMNDSS